MTENPYESPSSNGGSPDAQDAMGGQPTYVERLGGVMHGGTCLTWPFVKFEIYPLGFKIAGSRFTADNVVKLRRRRGLLSTGIEVIHSNPDAPKSLVYWAFRYSRVAAELGKIGFDVMYD